MNEPLYVYCARNHLGQFCGGQPYPDEGNWVDDFEEAHLRFKVGTIRSLVTKHVRMFPNLPIPEILSWKLDPKEAVILDESIRARKAVRSISERFSKDKRQAIAERQRDLEAQQKKIAEELARISA